VRKQKKKGNRGRQLRDAAEEKLARTPGTPPAIKEKSLEEIVHELQVHQIELEMQNEELRRAQLALEESRSKYMDLYDFSPVGYFTFTQQALIAEVNLTGAALLGAQRQKLINGRFRRFVTPGDQDLWDQHIMGALKKGERQSCDLVLKRVDGTTFPARLDSIRMEGDGETPVVRTVISDITERKRAEESLHQSEHLHRTLSGHLPAIVYRVFLKENFRMQFFTDMIEPITGYRADELSDGDVCSIDPLIIPEDRGNVVKTVRESVRENRPFEIEYRLKRKDGGIGHLYESGRPIYVNGEPLYIDGIILDVSERKQAEEALKKAYRDIQETKDQLIQAGRLAALGQLASGAAHEIRNPLHVMSMRLQLLELTGEDLKEDVRKVIDICKAQIERILQILEGLDEFSKTPVTNKTPNSLNRIVENVVVAWDERFRNHGIVTKTSYGEDIPSFMLDGEKITLVITHLISNAVHAMQSRETRNLGISTEKSPKGESVRIIVSDTGHGIGETDKARVFDPFFTTKRPDRGKGLGLAVAYGIIRDHGGRIWAENNAEGGASFFIELPVGGSANT